MSKTRSGASKFVIGSVLFSGMLVTLAAIIHMAGDVAPSLRAATNSDMATPTIAILDYSYILKSASPEEVGQYVIREFAPGQLDPHGAIDLMLARPITRNEVSELGIGCLPNFASIEEPPMMLVILKGDFAFTAVLSPESTLEQRYKYAAYVMDTWAAWPAFLRVSATGGLFRKALNDPSLPIEGPVNPTKCPPRTPGTRPYGAEVPGILFPTPPPEPTPTYEPMLPLPVPTVKP